MRERAVHASRGGMGEQTGESGLCCMHEYARDWSQTGLSPAGQLCSTRPRLAGTRIGPHLDMVKACAGLLSAPGSRRLRFVSIHVNRGMMSPKVREVFQAAAASRDAREGSVCAETSVLGALVAPVGSRKPLLHTVNDNERMSVSPGSPCVTPSERQGKDERQPREPPVRLGAWGRSTAGPTTLSGEDVRPSPRCRSGTSFLINKKRQLLLFRASL